jgi:hypothetical protein
VADLAPQNVAEPIANFITYRARVDSVDLHACASSRQHEPLNTISPLPGPIGSLPGSKAVKLALQISGVVKRALRTKAGSTNEKELRVRA